MLETLVNPKKMERKPWEMFFIGLIYASLSVILVYWIFANNSVLRQYTGLLIVTFTVMFTFPFMYYLIRLEAEEDSEIENSFTMLKANSRAIFALMWLFVGFVVAFSIWYVVLPSANLFQAQVQTYCQINSPGSIDSCVQRYAFKQDITGNTINGDFTRFLTILENNVFVMIFTLILSLIFGAGAIFILAWNATVISTAAGMLSNYNLSNLPMGLLRYFFHGLPEISSYFIAAVAGGIIGVGVIKYRFKGRKFWLLVQNAIILIFAALVILVIAGLMEVYITPRLF